MRDDPASELIIRTRARRACRSRGAEVCEPVAPHRLHHRSLGKYFPARRPKRVGMLGEFGEGLHFEARREASSSREPLPCVWTNDAKVANRMNPNGVCLASKEDQGWWVELDSNQRRRKPADLQNVYVVVYQSFACMQMFGFSRFFHFRLSLREQV